MTALTQDLSIDSEIAHVDVLLVAGEAYTIGDEIIRAGYALIQEWDDVAGAGSGLRWFIERGEDHTTPAAHSSGATLTLARKYGEGGGDPASQTVYVQPTDPGAVGAGKGWVKDDEDPPVLRLRNADDDGWDIQAAGSSPLTSVTVDLDAADIATLSSVPVEVVSAPGTGKVIVPVAASFQYKAGAVAFTNPTELDFLYGDPGLDGAGPSTGAVPFDATISAVAVFGLLTGGPIIDEADCDNQALMLEAATDPDGAGDGTARLQVLYYVMDLLP